MPTKGQSSTARKSRSSKDPGTRGRIGGRERASAQKRWWQVASKLLFRPIDSTRISCGGMMAEKKGSDVLYQDINTKYATWASGAHLGFMTAPFSIGLGVPITYASTASGYSFSGKIPVCTATLKCTNGQPMVLQISVVGAVNTAVDPDELSYTYTILVFCGTALTCRETGSFKGKRTGGTAQGVAGDFYGTHEWTLSCCPARHKP